MIANSHFVTSHLSAFMWVHMHAHTQNRKLTQHTVHFQTPLTLAYDIVDDENK